MKMITTDIDMGCNTRFGVMEAADKTRLLIDVQSYPNTFYTSISLQAARDFAENILEAVEAIEGYEGQRNQTSLLPEDQREAA